MLIRLSLFEESELIHRSKTGDFFALKKLQSVPLKSRGFFMHSSLNQQQFFIYKDVFSFFIAVEENILFF